MRVCSHLIERKPIGTHRSQVFCMPGCTETLGLVFLEAIKQGCY